MGFLLDNLLMFAIGLALGAMAGMVATWSIMANRVDSRAHALSQSATGYVRPPASGHHVSPIRRIPADEDE